MRGGPGSKGVRPGTVPGPGRRGVRCRVCGSRPEGVRPAGRVEWVCGCGLRGPCGVGRCRVRAGCPAERGVPSGRAGAGRRGRAERGVPAPAAGACRAGVWVWGRAERGRTEPGGPSGRPGLGRRGRAEWGVSGSGRSACRTGHAQRGVQVRAAGAAWTRGVRSGSPGCAARVCGTRRAGFSGSGVLARAVGATSCGCRVWEWVGGAAVGRAGRSGLANRACRAGLQESCGRERAEGSVRDGGVRGSGSGGVRAGACGC